MIPTTCLDCGDVIRRHQRRCQPCSARLQRRRNADPKRSGYRDRRYLSQLSTGLCGACGRSIEAGQGSRGHIIPLAHDYGSLETVPMHRSCNSSLGAREITR